jgi:hypothetical protein
MNETLHRKVAPLVWTPLQASLGHLLLVSPRALAWMAATVSWGSES